VQRLSFQIIRVRRHEIISCQPGDIDRLDPLYDRRISHSWNKLSAQGSILTVRIILTVLTILTILTYLLTYLPTYLLNLLNLLNLLDLLNLLN